MPKKQRNGPAQVYSDGRKFYVRIVPLETKQFPHGLALSTPCETEAEADGFAELVDEYLGLWIEMRTTKMRTRG